MEGNLLSSSEEAAKGQIPRRSVSLIILASNSRDEAVAGDAAPKRFSAISMAFLQASSASSNLQVPLSKHFVPCNMAKLTICGNDCVEAAGLQIAR